MLGEVLKRVDDLLWYQKLGDIADIDTVEYASLPPTHILHPKEPGATNPLLVHAYTFIPKNLDRSRKQPLVNIFAHPKDDAVAYAGVPVSDLIARMGYEPERYRELYSAQYHLGETAHHDIEEYRKRSPVTHAAELNTPLLIHTNTTTKT